MMKKIQVLFGVYAICSLEAMAASSANDTRPIEEKTMNEMEQDADSMDPQFVKTVKEALEGVRKESPQVHEDALRIWKKFDSTSKQINFTYRFWGRRLILWLKEEKKMVFDTEEKVGDVFKVLWREGLISKNAVVVLMVDAWSHLVYLEGSPAWEKRMETRRPEGGTAPNISSTSRSREKSV